MLQILHLGEVQLSKFNYEVVEVYTYTEDDLEIYKPERIYTRFVTYEETLQYIINLTEKELKRCNLLKN